MGKVYSHLSEEECQGTQPVQHQQGDQAQHVAPVQRERVLTAVPAETAEDGPVDGQILHRRPRPAQGRPQARQTTQAPPPVMRTPVGAGGHVGRQHVEWCV